MKKLLIVAVLLVVAAIATAYTNEELLQMKRTDPARYMHEVLGMDAKSARAQAKAEAAPPIDQVGPGKGQKDRAGGPDGYGYIFKDEREVGGPVYSWIDTVGTTNANITGDDAFGTIALPFTFTFYGNNCTYCYPSTNGLLGLSSGSTAYSNVALPTSNIPANTLCPYWDDLYAPGGTKGNILYKTVGTSPNRQFVVIWDSVYTLSGSYRLVFEVILAEADMSITYQYRYLDANARGQSATVGEQNLQSGNNFLQYSYNGDSLANGRAIKFWKPSFANDVGMYRFVRPIGICESDTIRPSVWIKNYGTSAASNIGVKLDIGTSYSSTVNVAGPLAPGDTFNVSTFTRWDNPPAGSYAVKCSTRYAGDQNLSNDKMTGTAYIVSFVERFDATNGNFTVSGGGWTWRAPAPPRPAPPSPPKVWTDPDSGPYVANADHKLVSPMFIATADTPVVMFYHWMYTETYFDGGNFSYSTNNGSTWTVLEPVSGPAYYGTLYSGERGWSGTYPWGMSGFRIPVSSSTAFLVRFRFTSDGSVQYDGWMIDDFAGVGMAKPAADVGVQRIIAPEGTIPWGTPVTPSA
ncbi:hypothetical protein FJY70_04490, partial [candidate division WOR-3 bacterium]|nr:hypothetical protein [candidate division WOR-3 bacterium]